MDEWNNGGLGSVTISTAVSARRGPVSIAAAARRGVFSIATAARRGASYVAATVARRGTVSITTTPCRGTFSSTASDVSQTPRRSQITLQTNFWRGRRECVRSSVLRSRSRNERGTLLLRWSDNRCTRRRARHY